MAASAQTPKLRRSWNTNQGTVELLTDSQNKLFARITDTTGKILIISRENFEVEKESLLSSLPLDQVLASRFFTPYLYTSNQKLLLYFYIPESKRFGYYCSYS